MKRMAPFMISVHSSGSTRSASDIEPTTSAKRMVTRRRSPSSDRGAPKGLPQLLQTLAPAGFSACQVGHVTNCLPAPKRLACLSRLLMGCGETAWPEELALEAKTVDSEKLNLWGLEPVAGALRDATPPPPRQRRLPHSNISHEN